MAKTVLVVEDETKLRDLIRSYLEREGYSVLAAGSGAEALSLGESAMPALAVLDLGLPDIDGEAVAAEFRRWGIPMIMLTARAAESDRVRGLELGADDYITKPFSPRELILRVHAVLRRSWGDELATGTRSYGGGQLTLDPETHDVVVRGESIDLTPTEWSILSALAESPRRIFSRLELANRSRGYEFEGYERTVDTHVKNLRRKIEADVHKPIIVETVVGIGYRFTLKKDAE